MFKSFHFYKLPFWFCLLAGFTITCLAACRKTDAAIKAYIATESDAASIITNDLLPVYGGLVGQLNACLIMNRQLTCGTTKDTVFKGTNPTTSSITYSYQFQARNQLNCDTKSSYITFTGKHNYEGAVYVGNDESVGSIVLTEGVSKNTNHLNLNFKRSGHQRAKSLDPQNMNSTLEIKSSNLVTDKITCKIISGTADIILYNTNEPSLYSFSGSITFSGNGRAIITLNSGTPYHISW